MDEKKQELEKKVKDDVKKQEKQQSETVVQTKNEKDQNNKEGNGFKKVEKVVKNENNNKKTTTDNLKEKSNKSLYILGVIVIVAVIIAIVLIMSLFQDKPEKTLGDMFSALKAGDFLKVQEYVNYDEVMDSSDIFDEENMNVEAQKLLFDRLEWDVKNVNIENDKAVIEVDVTNKDLKTVIGNYMQKALQDLFSGQNIEDTDIENSLMEELKSDSVQMTTSTRNIELTKQDEKWKVTANNELIDAILPGLRETMESLNSY